jgi:hypothetical protein
MVAPDSFFPHSHLSPMSGFTQASRAVQTIGLGKDNVAQTDEVLIINAR